MKEPKSIFILSSGPRSGSTWLTKAISRIENTNTRSEIFNQVENKDLLKIKETSKAYIHYVLKKIWKNKSQNKNFVFSTFIEHFEKVETLITLIMISDLVVFNYRKNVLDQWVSYRKAAKTGFWKKKDLTNVKIIWSEELFMKFRKRCEVVFALVKRLKMEGINLIQFNYEEIHALDTDQEKINLINKQLNKFDLNIGDLSDTGLIKQNYYTDYKDVFINYDDFLAFKQKGYFQINYQH